MREWPWSGVVVILATCGAVLGVWASGLASPPRSDSPTTPKSVTVFPIVLNSGKPIDGVAPTMPKEFAELVGLMLERGGVKEIEIAETQYSPPEGDDLAGLAESFGQFVRSRNVGTEYALYGQFIGTPAEGVQEIRLVAADREGKVVLSERRSRE